MTKVRPTTSSSNDTGGTQNDRRVLFVISALGVGGAETWIMSMLEHFADTARLKGERISIDICLTSGESAHFDERATALGARLFYVQYSRANLFRFIWQFRRILRRGRYDLIHDHQDYTAGWHFLMGLGLLPKKRFVHIHNTYLTISKVRGTTVFRRATLRAGKWLVDALATDIIGTSHVVLNEYGFSAAYPRPLVVRCGVKVDRFNEPREAARRTVREEFGWPPDSRILLFAGRLDGSFNQKNHTFAVRVARVAAARDARVKLILAGGGRTDADTTAGTEGQDSSVFFAGARDDVPRLMRAADLLLFPSIAEGLGMVAVEAQAAGLRVLASSKVPDEVVVVPGSVTFFDLDAGADAWASKVLQLLDEDHQSREEWNRAVQTSAFSIEQSVLDLLRAYRTSSSK